MQLYLYIGPVSFSLCQPNASTADDVCVTCHDCPFSFSPHVQTLELSYSVSVCAFVLLMHANCICVPATVCLFVCTNVYLIGYCSAFLVSGPNFCTGSVGREEIRFIFTGMLEEKQYLKNTFRGDFIYEGSWAEDKQEVFSLKRKPDYCKNNWPCGFCPEEKRPEETEKQAGVHTI